MPRYLVERLFPGGLELPPNQQGVQAAQKVIATNAEHGVTWVHSYVTPDKKKTFCIYDAPSPEAIRQVAGLVERSCSLDLTAWKGSNVWAPRQTPIFSAPGPFEAKRSICC